MIFRSSLQCPDLMPHFKHLVSRPMGHSFGHDVPSDWGDKPDDDPVFGQFKNCGMWTHDEAAILYNVARRAPGVWIDIGAHSGWTTMHIGYGCNICYGIEPMLAVPEFAIRFYDNMDGWMGFGSQAMYSDNYFSKVAPGVKFNGFCIDGCHEDGQPQRDANNAEKHLADTGVIIFHDGVGRPVREAAQMLMAHGFKCRAYFTPYLVLCCWRGDFTPPDHEGDPVVKAAHLDGRYPDFDFTRCE